MADDDDNDNEFLAYLERLGPKCKTLTELIQTQIREVLKGSQQQPSAQSGNYLEQQNQMLLAQLLKLQKSDAATGQLTQDTLGAMNGGQNAPLQTPPSAPLAPPPPEKKKPFWS